MNPYRAFVRGLLLASLSIPLCSGAVPPDQQNGPTNWGVRRPVAFDELQRGFDQPDRLYAPFAFWFWDAPLDR